MGKWWFYGKIIGKPWENGGFYENIIGKPWENGGLTLW